MRDLTAEPSHRCATSIPGDVGHPLVLSSLHDTTRRGGEHSLRTSPLGTGSLVEDGGIALAFQIRYLFFTRR